MCVWMCVCVCVCVCMREGSLNILQPVQSPLLWMVDGRVCVCVCVCVCA